MKKNYFKHFTAITAMVLSITSFGQNYSQDMVGTSEVNFGAPSKALDSCGFNANAYLLSKMNNAEIYYLNTGDFIAGTDGLPSRAQYYDAPQDIIISGVSFYAFITSEGNLPTTTTRVITNLYEATSDSTISALLATDTIDVTGNSFDPFLPNIQFTSAFDAPVTVSSAYFVSVETLENDSLTLVSNSFTGDDGANEHLGQSFYSWPQDTQFDGWFKHSEYAGYNGDFIIMPVIKTQISAATPFSMSSLNDTLCVDVANFSVLYFQESIFSNRMYSANHAAQLTELNVDYFETQINATNPAAHSYTTPGNYTVVASDTFKLWGPNNIHTNCVVTESFDIVVVDTALNGDFIDDNDHADLTVTFNPATASDSLYLVKWIFDDAGAESTDISPTHTFSNNDVYDIQMILDNGCAIDTVTHTIDFTIGINELDLNKLSIYPNPSKTGLFNLKNIASNVKNIQVMNSLGQIITSIRPNGAQMELNISNVQRGVYFLTLESDSGEKATRRLIVTK